MSADWMKIMMALPEDSAGGAHFIQVDYAVVDNLNGELILTAVQMWYPLSASSIYYDP